MIMNKSDLKLIRSMLKKDILTDIGICTHIELYDTVNNFCRKRGLHLKNDKDFEAMYEIVEKEHLDLAKQMRKFLRSL